MRRRSRKFIGAIAMLGFAIVYALIAMALAQSRLLQDASKPMQAIGYALLGLAWILPILPLIKWMEGGEE